MYTNLIVGVDGRPGGRDDAALAAMPAATGARRHLVFVPDAQPSNGAGSQGDLHLEVVGASRRRGIPDRRRLPRSPESEVALAHAELLAHHVDVPLTAPADCPAVKQWREFAQPTGVGVEP